MSCHALPSFISDNRDTHTSILSLLFIQTKSFLGFNADRSFISLFEQLPRTSRFLRSGAVGLRMYTSKEVRNCEQELAEVNEDILEAKVIRVKAMSAGNLSFAEKVQVEINRLLEKELFLMQKQSESHDLRKLVFRLR